MSECIADAPTDVRDLTDLRRRLDKVVDVVGAQGDRIQDTIDVAKDTNDRVREVSTLVKGVLAAMQDNNQKTNDNLRLFYKGSLAVMVICILVVFASSGGTTAVETAVGSLSLNAKAED